MLTEELISGSELLELEERLSVISISISLVGGSDEGGLDELFGVKSGTEEDDIEEMEEEMDGGTEEKGVML